MPSDRERAGAGKGGQPTAKERAVGRKMGAGVATANAGFAATNIAQEQRNQGMGRVR